jgi:Cu+-exporting ATPase
MEGDVAESREARAARAHERRRTIVPVQGMHCASCMSNVERAIAAVPHVVDVSVNLATGSAAVVHEGASREAIAAAVERAGYAVPAPAAGAAPAPARGHAGAHWRGGAPRAALARDHAHVDVRRLGRRFVVASAATAVVMVLTMDHAGHTAPARTGALAFAAAAAATLVVLAYAGADYYRGFAASLRRRVPDMNTLIATGTSAAFLLSVVVRLRPDLAPSRGGVYLDTAAMIVTLLLLGRLLEARARRRALSAIAELTALAVPQARVVRGGEERLVPAESVAVGEEVAVPAGEAIPVDGVVLAGTSAVDEALVTGESLPVTRGPGDPVVGGTINGGGPLRVRVTRTGDATTLAAIVRAVEEAQAGKAPLARLADRIAAAFVPAVFALALLAVLLWALLGGAEGLALGLVRGVAVLMIACPCALGLATPMAIVVGIGRAARAGVLFRDGEALERAATLRTVIFDKTGTLTMGRPEVTEVTAEAGATEAEVVAIAAALESGAGHPLGRAIVAHAERTAIARATADGVEVAPGLGVGGRVAGRDALVGSARFLAERGVATRGAAIPLDAARAAGAADAPGTVLVARDGRLVGAIRVADRLRPEAPEALRALRSLGVSAGMITGDVEPAARAVGEPLGLEPMLSGRLPSEKAAAVRALGARVGMVGDGINDGPALSQADVGFAMAGGTDVARAASTVTLVRSDLRLVPGAIRLARATRAAIRRNLLWAFAFNVVGIPLAAGLLEPGFGVAVSPAAAAFAMAMSSVIVVLSSLSLRGARLAAAALAAGAAVVGVAGSAPAFRALAPAAAHAQDDIEENPFVVQAEAVPTPGDPRGDHRVVVTFRVPSGMYLYRERLIVALPNERTASEVAYPAGIVKHDPFEDREMEIYASSTQAVLYIRVGSRRPEEVFPLVVVAEYQGCTSEFCFFPQSDTLRVTPSAAATSAAEPEVPSGAGLEPASAAAPAGGAGGHAAPAGGGVDIAARLASKGYLLTFLGVFLSGILLSFTPCVFPMIPITVSVIGARGAGSLPRSFSLSVAYVLGLAMTYAALGVFAAKTGALFGAFLQNPWIVGFVVLVLSAMALSMFGLFELQMPSVVATRLQGGARSGYGGVFLMGIVAGLVASPCVGPVILGLLLFIATTGSLALGFSLLLTLGLGMGVLFIVIGTFSGAISSLPRAGGWMDRVKELFGVLLLAMALYFLRPLLDPVLFAGLAGLLLLVLAGFGGVFEPGAAGWVGRVRRTLLLVMLAAGLALFGGALREAGVLLPRAERAAAARSAANASGHAGAAIPWITSEPEGIAAARLAGRPLVIDFTADWCLVCHEIDAEVLRDPRVVAAAKGFVAVRLDFTRLTPEVRALQVKYGIRGLPMILFLDREGRVLPDLTVTGLVKPEEFLGRMARAAGGG